MKANLPPVEHYMAAGEPINTVCGVDDCPGTEFGFVRRCPAGSVVICQRCRQMHIWEVAIIDPRLKKGGGG